MDDAEVKESQQDVIADGIDLKPVRQEHRADTGAVTNETMSVDDQQEASVPVTTCDQDSEVTVNCVNETEEDVIFPQEESIDLTVLKLNEISRQMEHLGREFQSKIKYDAHKEKIIDDLYQELQTYKSDFVKKHTQSMFMDVIKIIDDIRKLVNHYNSRELTENDLPKLLAILEDIPSDLEDLFYLYGAESFTCDGGVFNPGRQRVIKKVKSLERSRDNTVAKSLRPGYEWEGKVIRPEMVSVYSYAVSTDETKMRGSHE